LWCDALVWYREQGVDALYSIAMRFRATPKKTERARQLRARATSAERKVWELLRGRRILDLKFRRQHVIDGFIVDFYCAEIELVLEIDGSIHTHSAQKEYDQARERHMNSLGLRLVRLTNEEVSASQLRRILEPFVPPLP